MARNLRLVLFLALAITAPGAPSRAGDVDVNVNIGAPPPRIFFERAPRLHLVPNTEVYYLPDSADYDFYRYNDRWYVNRDGYWYRAKSYRGPFAPIEVIKVPRVLIGLPGEYRRHPSHPHGGPPGQMRKEAGHPGHGGHSGHGGPHGHGKKGGKKN